MGYSPEHISLYSLRFTLAEVYSIIPYINDKLHTKKDIA